MSWYFYSSFQRSISAHMHTNLECFFRDCPCHNMLRDFLWSSVDLQIRGARLCICHPHSQGVLLPHFGSCLEAVDSESQKSMSWYFYTSFQRSISDHMHTNLEWYFGIVHVAKCQEIPFAALSIGKSEGHVLCICHPLLLRHFGSCLEAVDSE